MAKPRKPKSEDQKADNSGAVVHHQKLCLSIDMEKRRIYGFTELKVSVPESGIVGLHADNLEIERVSVDGEPAEFEYLPHYQGGENGERWSSGLSASSAADAACSSYASALERELVPNLLILCCKSVQPPSDQQGQPNGENGLLHQPGESTQNVKLVRIDYWVEKPEAGLHFWNNVLHTDNQIRRARCWFPCMDDPSQLCCYDLEFTVAHNLVAVSCGSLLYQVLSKDDPPCKTYVYRLNVPVIAQWVSLAVAPFEILPDRHSVLLSHMCLRLNLSKLKNTVGFFHSAFNHYEDYLSASFPFGSYKQVFVGPEMMISSFNLGASMGIFSSQILFDEKVIDKTIETRIKLAYALARQWFGVYITAEAPSDEWLLDGLAGFLTDSFIKRFLGNNEARYRRYKANCAVCKADVSGATALSSSASKNLHGTQCIGLYGKIRSWKSVAILQMLEKQMGPESFRKILQIIVFRAQDTTHSLRTLSTKEWSMSGRTLFLGLVQFRHFANKIGNLERPFLKEFFPRWVGSCGCPVLRLGLSYNKRKNMIELAVLRGCTATQDSIASVPDGNADSETREGDVGWPGMMSIRVHELDGMYDHPILPMAGETWQLLEIQCHSKLAARRIQKPKKSSKPDGSDDNGDAFPSDTRSSAESPLLWLRADPQMEYLAELHFSQPVQMWINQLEKDRDVIAQSQAITMLEALPQLSFSVVNALNNFLSDTKAFWRVRIEAAFALANTASEETDWSGLIHLVKYYKSRRFDANIGLPRPNDFHDFPEYFVLEAVPHAIAMVRAADRKSPREAVEFVLQLLKYNDNNGNPYSDVYWLAALVQSISELEFGQQSILFLSSLLKHIDRLLQFDRVMPSYNGILTISCIRTLTKIASKLSAFIPLDRVSELIKPFRNIETLWQVRIEASRALLDLEFHGNGIDASLSLFMDYLNEEASARGQVKLAIHAMRLCQIRCRSESNDEIKIPTLTSLLCLLESHKAFNNIILRHHLFCILQILAERLPTLHGVSRVQEQSMGAAETWIEQKNKLEALTKVRLHKVPFPIVDTQNLSSNGLSIPEASKDADTVSTGNERRMPVVKIRVKQSAASSRGEEADRSQGRQNEADRAASSSMSVDAPRRVTNEPVGISNQNNEEVNSCHDRDSRITASIGSARPANDGDDIGKELQCTADSRKVSDLPVMEDRSSPSIVKCNDGETDAKKYISLQTLSVGSRDQNGTPEAIVDQHVHEKAKEKKKKEKKRRREEKDHKDHHNDPEYLERKRLRKEKKQREKEIAKLQVAETRASSGEVQSMKEEARIESASADLRPNEPRGSKVIIKQKEKEISKLQAGEVRASASASEFQSSKQDPRTLPSTVGLRSNEPSGSKLVLKNVESKGEVSEGSSVQKLRIKIKNRSLNKL